MLKTRYDTFFLGYGLQLPKVATYYLFSLSRRQILASPSATNCKNGEMLSLQRNFATDFLEAQVGCPGVPIPLRTLRFRTSFINVI